MIAEAGDIEENPGPDPRVPDDRGRDRGHDQHHNLYLLAYDIARPHSHRRHPPKVTICSQVSTPQTKEPQPKGKRTLTTSTHQMQAFIARPRKKDGTES